jgi:general secretion pathway protein D
MHNIKKIVLLLLSTSLINITVADKDVSSKVKKNNLARVIGKNADESMASSDVLRSDQVVLNFENSDIQTTIKAISQLSGKNFVVDPRVKGTVTIISDKPISKNDSYKVLETALRMQGFAVVEGDGVIKVLPEVDAKTYGVQFENSFKRNKDIGDQVVTKVFIIKHGSAMQLSNTLRPLIAPNNSISVYQNSNALIITDYASNLNRISKLIEQLSKDALTETKPTIIDLKYAIAADVLQTLQSYLQGGGSSGGYSSGGSNDGPTTTITVVPNSNSLIIYSTVQSRVDELVKLALQLDKANQDLKDGLHVVYLKNADAAHIADVLKVVAYNQDNPDLQASSSLAKLSSEPTSSLSSSGSGGGGMGSSFGGGSGGGGGRSSSGSSRSSMSSSPNGDKNSPKILIQAEPTTNSLIIRAPDSVYRNLRMIIDMLDIRRAQVVIEAMIVDVNTTLAGTFGVQWLVGGGNNNIGAIGVANYGGSTNSGPSSALSSVAQSIGGVLAGGGGANGANAATAAAGIPNEVFVGLVTGTVNVGGQQIPSIGALADMISSNNAFNVISRPTILTLDNEEAKIMVGQEVPVPTGSFQNQAGIAQAVTTVARQSIGTQLVIKPLITQSGAIQMDVFQEDSKIDSTAQTANSTNGPTFLKRNIRSTLLVDDGQIIAIGGMVMDGIDMKKNGIPLLSDIPFLGWLFSWQTRVHTKQNLVLFLRPVIVKNQDGLLALSNKRYNYIVGEQDKIKAKGNLLLPRIDPITLDNQIPYNNEIPKQEDNLVKDLPIVDARQSVVGNKTIDTNNKLQ